MMTQQRYTHPAITEALLFLAQRCDYAQSKDNVGFDATDTHFGHRAASVLEEGGDLSPEDQRRAYHCLPKYTRQLTEVGITLPESETFENFVKAIEPDWDRIELEQAEAKRQAEIVAKLQLVEKSRQILSESVKVEKLTQTHPDVALAVTYLNYALNSSNDFYRSLLCRMGMGKNLTENQQLAMLKAFDRDAELLADTGIKLVTQADLKSFLAAIESEQPKKIPGTLKLDGQSVIAQFDYNPSFVGRIKGIVESLNLRKCWQPEERLWKLPLSAAHRLIEAFPEFEIDPRIIEAAQDAIADAEASKILACESAQELIKLADVDSQFSNGWSLFPYQKDVVARSILTIETSPLRGPILGLDMGLGKTLQALVIARAYQRLYDDAVLVVCPATLKDNWLREAAIAEVAIEVFSWAKMPEPLHSKRYILIADEAHYAQSGEKSQRGKKFLDLSRDVNCRAVLPLTGTPMPNGRPINLLPLLQAIAHPVAKDGYGYQVRYCAGHRNRFGWDVTGASHLDELSERIKDGLIRLKKKDVLKDLPEKTLVMRGAEVKGDRLAIWKAARDEALAEYEHLREVMRLAVWGEIDPSSDEARRAKAAAILMMGNLRKAASHAKVDSAIELATEILEQDQQVVLFTEFIESAKELKQELAKVVGQHKVELLLGETPVEERQSMVDRFQKGQSKVFISTSRAGGTGITLTAANTVIMVDRPWRPGDADQCHDRCYRIGQKNNVLVIWLQYSSIDEKVDSILQQKAERIELVLQGKRKTLRGIKDPNDIVLELLDDVLGRKK